MVFIESRQQLTGGKMNSKFKEAFTFKFNQLNRLNKNPLIEALTASDFSKMLKEKNPLAIEAMKYCISIGLKP